MHSRFRCNDAPLVEESTPTGAISFLEIRFIYGTIPSRNEESRCVRELKPSKYKSTDIWVCGVFVYAI